MSFADQCLLLAGAPDRCVDHLLRRLRHRWSFADAWALAAIGTDAALAAVAEDVRHGGDRTEYENGGVWVPPTGPARYRFSPHRRAVLRRPLDQPQDLAVVEHPVGLPVEQLVRDPAVTLISWHYLSLRVTAVPGLPAWPAGRVHLAGVPASCMWTLFASVDERGRYHGETVVFDEPPDPEEQQMYRSPKAPDVAARSP